MWLEYVSEGYAPTQMLVYKLQMNPGCSNACIQTPNMVPDSAPVITNPNQPTYTRVLRENDQRDSSFGKIHSLNLNLLKD